MDVPPGAELPGGAGVQGGVLRVLHDGGAEARPEGVRVDHVQEQGGVGEEVCEGGRAELCFFRLSNAVGRYFAEKK